MAGSAISKPEGAQPDEATKSERISAICAEHMGREGPLLPILHAVQAEYGCIDSGSEAQIAAMLNLTRAELHGVVSFYHDFTAKADPRPVVAICRAEACQARGVEAMIPAANKAAGEAVCLKTVYCLGLCSAGPAARIGDTLHPWLSEKALVKLIEEQKPGASGADAAEKGE